MLSRVAERVYWTGRYIERAESTARLVNAYTTQVMDLPRGTEPGWKHLVDITGAHADFESRYACYDERSTLGFLVADPEPAGSIMNALTMARENVRTTRDVLPTEAWELTNELYLYARANVESAIGRRDRFAFLKEVILRCQQLTGLLTGTMSHDAAYDFMRAGRNLERADMTTRIVDSAVLLLMPRREAPGEYDTILWVNVLKSSSAYQMYRQHARHRIAGAEVVRYLLTDDAFPRAVAHTLAEAAAALGNLPRSATLLVDLARLRMQLASTDLQRLDHQGLHRLIDDIQSELNHVHQQIRATWFALPPPAESQAQSI